MDLYLTLKELHNPLIKIVFYAHLGLYLNGLGGSKGPFLEQ